MVKSGHDNGAWRGGVNTKCSGSGRKVAAVTKEGWVKKFGYVALTVRKNCEELMRTMRTMTSMIVMVGWLVVGFVSASQAALLTKEDFNLYGYVDASYTQNFKNPSNNINQNRIFDVDSNSFRPHLAQLVFEKEGKGGGELADAAGFRIKLNFGEDAEFTGGSTGNDDVDFQEAYAQFIAPVGNGIDLRIGRMNTLIGYEVIESPLNPNFSRSWLFGLGQPFTTTGIRGSYTFTDQVSWSVGVINQFAGNVSDGNNSKGIETAISVTPTEWLSMVGYGFWTPNDGSAALGGVGGDARRLLGGGIVDIQLLDSTEVVLEAYYAKLDEAFATGRNAVYKGFAGYLIQDFTEQWGVRFRGEIFDDVDGFASCFGGNSKTGGKASSCAQAIGSGGQTLWEITATLQYKPVPSLITRLEFRHDDSDKKTFFKGTKAVDNQQTLGAEVIFLF